MDPLPNGRFFGGPLAFNGVTIESILLGGSVAYSYAGNTIDAKDWDGVVTVRKKTEISTLINENREGLCKMLSIVTEEHPALQVPDAGHPMWSKLDGVRFVGWTATKAKKGVKILSLEYFVNDKRTLNLWSFKDKRIFLSGSLGSPLIVWILHITFYSTTQC
jgi:hypothetical protein